MPPSSRREFLASLSGIAAASLAGCGQAHAPLARAYPLFLGPVLLEVAKGHFISTIGYNGTAPGPVIHLREGEATPIDIENQLDWPEWIHWHGLDVPLYLDGTPEERSTPVPARGRVRRILPPQPPGARWVHSMTPADVDFTRGMFTGQLAFVYVEPRQHPGSYDREVFLATHEWEPFLNAEIYNPEEVKEEFLRERERRRLMKEHSKNPSVQVPPPEEPEDGWQIAYQRYSINGTMLGEGDPVKVKEGQRVLFHILNGNATEPVRLALPGHQFLVTALDGNPVPNPQTVAVLELGAGERVDALVDMKNPGVWALASTDDSARAKGLGIVVEYADKQGDAVWAAAPASEWDYATFAKQQAAPAPGQTAPIVISKIKTGSRRFNRWSINGREYQDTRQPATLHRGVRTRLAIDNRSDEAHSLHLHRSIFEVASMGGRPVSGIRKDTIVVKAMSKIEVDFTPEEPGLTLFQSQQQVQMDHGLKALFRVE